MFITASIAIAIIAIAISAYAAYLAYQALGALSEVKYSISKVETTLGGLTQIFQRTRPCVKVEYARLFSIKCDGIATIVKDALNRTILVLPRNASKFAVEYFEAKYHPDLVVFVPVKRVVLASSTEAALIWRLDREYHLGLLKRIVGIMWGKKYKWYIPEIEQALKNGSIVDLGYVDNPDYERLLSLKPDLVIVYTVPGYEASARLIEKLKELKIPFVVDNEWLEKDVLARFEWIKFIALFFGVEDKAERLFDKVVAQVKSFIKRAHKARERPYVAWFLIWRGYVWAPSRNSYVVDLIKKCNGIYLYENYTKVDLEVVLALANKTDVLIYSSYLVKSLNDLLKIEPRLKALKAVRERRVYALSPDYWQVGYAYTERLVGDLCAILHPELFKGYEVRFFKPLT